MLQFPFPFPRISLTMTLWTLKQGGRSLYRGPSWDQLSHRKYTSPLHTIHLSSFSAFSLMLHICFPHVDCPFLQVARARSVFWKYLCFTISNHNEFLVLSFLYFLYEKALHTSPILLILIPPSSKGRQRVLQVIQ